MKAGVILLAMLAAGPALAAHNGVVRDRSMPELSDIALAIFAAGAVWFVRRSMRARFRKD